MGCHNASDTLAYVCSTDIQMLQSNNIALPNLGHTTAPLFTYGSVMGRHGIGGLVHFISYSHDNKGYPGDAYLFQARDYHRMLNALACILSVCS